MDKSGFAIVAVAVGAAAYYWYRMNGDDCSNPGCGTCQTCCSCGGNVQLSASQIRDYAASAGFSGDDLDIAVAVALAESSGNTHAYNPEVAACTPEGQGSYGLWQIYTKLHPEFSGPQLYDAQNNANEAFAIYNAAGQTFRPWSTYKSGKYQQYMPLGNSCGGCCS